MGTYQECCNPLQALLILPLIAMLALLMSSPIFLHTHLHIPLIDDADRKKVRHSEGFRILYAFV